MQRHTPTPPTPKAPQRHSLQPPTLPQDTKKVKDGLENHIPGPPKIEIVRKHTPPHQIQSQQPTNTLGNIRVKKEIFQVVFEDSDR